MLDINMFQQLIVHLNIPKSELNINSLVTCCKNASRSVFQQLFQALIVHIQHRVLDYVLGSRWHPNQSKPAPWQCPDCGSRHGFKRRGSRRRSLKTSNGTVHFPLLQVTCCDCGKTFSPFPRLLGIARGHRLTREFEQLICHVVKDMSYRKTSQLFHLLADAEVSPHTAHRVVQNYGQRAKIVENDQQQIEQLQYDSTKIKASADKRGIDVHVAISIGQRTQVSKKRVHCDKTLVNVQVSRSPSKLKKILKNTTITQLTVDGLSGLIGYIQKKKLNISVQRCLWHIPKTALHNLLLDGVDKERRRKLVRPMKRFLFDEKRSVFERLMCYKITMDFFAHSGFSKTATLLENAFPYLFTYKSNAEKNPDKNIKYDRTISIAERLMREINRRFENGARWTAKGAENLLTLKLIEELNNTQSYDYLWKLKKQLKATCQVILC